MSDWLNSPGFLVLVMTLAGAALYGWRRRRLKRASAESWEMFHAACTTSSSKTPEAEWITALRASVAGDVWKPGLKPSASEAQIPQHPSCCDFADHTESTTRRAAGAHNVSPAQPHLLSRDAPEPAESVARHVTDPEIVSVRCESHDQKIVKLRHWLSEGKTLFTVMMFPPVDDEWEKIHEGQGVLEEVSEGEAQFRFRGANPRMFLPDFSVGYDRKRKRPLIRLRERR
jgi:hypothetical protein